MRFAQRVYLFGGIWGVLVCLPIFWNEPWMAQHSPPAVTHPEYYYGFATCAIAWQVIFLLMSRDVVRFRPLMPASFVEKFGYVIAMITLYAFHRVPALLVGFAMTDLLLGVLFVAAYMKTPRHYAR